MGLPLGFELVEGERLSVVGHDLAGREAGMRGKNTQKITLSVRRGWGAGGGRIRGREKGRKLNYFRFFSKVAAR